jgi:hypothetical protein
MKLYNQKKINDYLKGFGGLFICHKTDNTTRCGQFLSGLLHECKSNIERMCRRHESLIAIMTNYITLLVNRHGIALL